MKMQTKVIIGFVLLCLLTGVLFLSLNNKDKAEPADSAHAKLGKVTLQLKWVYNAGFTGDLVAKEKAFWQEQGLDVEVRAGGVGITPIKVVTSGDAQFGVATGDQMFSAVEEGNPVIGVALAYQRNPLTWIVRVDSKINSPADFKGKKVGLSFIDDEALFNAMMAKVGLDPKKDITIIPIKFDNSPFLRGDVDAFPVYENTQAIEISSALRKQGVETKLVGPVDVGLVSYSNLYFTTADFAKQHPEIVRAFVFGVLKGWEYARAHPDEAAQIVAKYDKEDQAAIIQESVKSSVNLVQPLGTTTIGEMTKEGWLSTQNILLDSNQLKKAQDVEKIYTDQYAEAFNK
jgi:NitT/TauT family transport system substrate-binding protein